MRLFLIFIAGQRGARHCITRAARGNGGPDFYKDYRSPHAVLYCILGPVSFMGHTCVLKRKLIINCPMLCSLSVALGFCQVANVTLVGQSSADPDTKPCHGIGRAS